MVDGLEETRSIYVKTTVKVKSDVLWKKAKVFLITAILVSYRQMSKVSRDQAYLYTLFYFFSICFGGEKQISWQYNKNYLKMARRTSWGVFVVFNRLL